MPNIHPTALLSDEVTVAPDAIIGPYCVLEGHITIGSKTRLAAGVHVFGRVEIGAENTIHSHAVIGDLPQDLSFDPQADTGVSIGDRNTIRENVTIHRATQESGNTVVGNDCLLMAGVHLGHDSCLSNHVILANNTLLGGFVTVGSRVFLGGGTVVHQFVKVGSYGMTQGNSGLSQDLPPYCISHGINLLAGLNSVGLRRNNFDAEQRKEIKTLFKALLSSNKNRSEALTEIEKSSWSPQGRLLIDAVKNPSRKGIMSR